MHMLRNMSLAVLMLSACAAFAQQPAAAPLPEIHQLMREVQEHQKQLDQVRENYTYSSLQTVEDLDAQGQVKKTEVTELEQFFVNGHPIGRTVKKGGKALDEHEQQKEQERVMKQVEKAQSTPRDQPLEGPQITIGRVLEIMEVRNPRRVSYRGRPAIAFDFVGRKDAKTHGMAEDASKKMQGTIWVDEADREVAHMDVSFMEDFRVGGGLLASISKGSNFHLDQAAVNSELWLPTGMEAAIQARVLLVKGVRQRFTEKDYDYKRFRVETQQTKDTKVVGKTQ